MEAPRPVLSLALERVGSLWARLLPNLLARVELSSQRFFILKACEVRPQTMSELTHNFEVPKSTITFHVDALEARGFVERQADPADRRVTRVNLLPEGRSVLGRLQAEMDAGMARLTESISPAEVTIIETGVKLLQNHADAIQAIFDEGP